VALADGEPQPGPLDLHERADRRVAQKSRSRHAGAGCAGHGHRHRHRCARRRDLRHAAGQRVGLRRPRGRGVRAVVPRVLARHPRHHLRGHLVSLDPADRLRQLLGVAVEEPAAVPHPGGRARFPALRRDHADDALDGPGSATRGLRPHCVGQGPGGAHRRLQARAEERPHSRGDDHRRPARGPARRHRRRGDDLRAAGHGTAHGGGDPLPRLSGRADQRHAGGGHARDPQPRRRPHLRVGRSARARCSPRSGASRSARPRRRCSC